MNALKTLSPKIAITAPDGRELWIDPLEDTGSSVLPNGYGVALRFGEPAKGDARVTTSKAEFLAGQGSRILETPGPLGIPVGVWVAVGVLGLAVGVAAWRRR